MFDAKQVIISDNVTADFAMVANLERAAIYKEFAGLKTSRITEEQVGRKLRSGTNGITL